MKKFLPITLFLLNIKIALSGDVSYSVDYFEINSKRDSIIGNLWHGHEIPQEDLKDFFKLIEKNFNHKIEKDNHKKDEIFNNAVFIDKWKRSMIEFLNFTYATDKEISDIEKFAAQVDFLKNNFSVTTIGNGLKIIAEKY
ncbi:hypothetical protein [Candidatus Odyssella acanthamoebae]|uniref:Uncharacterized protein n=1 Tax=Candidatus Odyssella acanthamoebae TaxID=91604 RepID=A0A077ASX2_9PROT|nr:hypothetical protein [Candidatus Paracaedibacter acanthamoebae]AIK96307.1 hypothetical protein ID47_05505 [Candidatus Paracaedibacter acanthamoebae]